MMPFLKIPIVLPGDPEEKLEDKETQARIQPAEIESFNDAYHWGCLIVFKSGEIKMTKLTADQVEQVEQLLAQYWQKFNEAVRNNQKGSNLLLQ
jgi:hypothetical protein